VQVKPTHQVAYLYSDVKITCVYSGVIIWRKERTVLSSKTEGNVLKLKNVTESDSGIYACYGGHSTAQSELLVGSKLNYSLIFFLEIASGMCTVIDWQ